MPVAQLHPGVVGVDLAGSDPDLGLATGEVRDHCRDQAGSNRAEDTDGQLDGPRVADLLHRTLGIAFCGEQDLGMMEQDPPDLGQDDQASPSFEHRSPDIVLQRSHLLGDRGGRIVHLAGGRVHAAMVGDLTEDAQSAQAQFHSESLNAVI